jgi:hypothetical protein
MQGRGGLLCVWLYFRWPGLLVKPGVMVLCNCFCVAPLSGAEWYLSLVPRGLRPALPLCRPAG